MIFGENKIGENKKDLERVLLKAFGVDGDAGWRTRAFNHLSLQHPTYKSDSTRHWGQQYRRKSCGIPKIERGGNGWGG